MDEATIPQFAAQILPEATLVGPDRRLPQLRHATVPRPRHLRYGQRCWTRELGDISKPIMEVANCEKLT